MKPSEIPQELIDIIDERAGKKHSREGRVLTTLAEILTRYDELKEPKMQHECIIEKRPDLYAVKEQYLIRCRCHMEAFVTWQPEEPEFVCPESLKSTDA